MSSCRIWYNSHQTIFNKSSWSICIKHCEDIQNKSEKNFFVLKDFVLENNITIRLQKGLYFNWTLSYTWRSDIIARHFHQAFSLFRKYWTKWALFLIKTVWGETAYMHLGQSALSESQRNFWTINCFHKSSISEIS